MEDNRFLELTPVFVKKNPEFLEWFLSQEEYLVDEMISFKWEEVDFLSNKAVEAFNIFSEATDHIISKGNLDYLEIPKPFQKVIEHAWHHRDRNPFFLGRFDFSGSLDTPPVKVIEFNADTCTMLPETLFWQPLQLKHAGKRKSFNTLNWDIKNAFERISNHKNEKQVVLASSLGFEEDKLNVQAIASIVEDDFFVFYRDLQDVIFSEDGVFIEEGDGYVQVDVMLKLFPWDWIYTEETELSGLLTNLILNEKVVVLNPPYTSIWQNKMFLNYITEHFPNNVIAKSYSTKPPHLEKHVVKSSFGRLGEEVEIVEKGEEAELNFQPKTYQEYLRLPQDDEGNYYQLGMLYTHRPSALNIRCSSEAVINDDCEFYCHFIEDSRS